MTHDHFFPPFVIDYDIHLVDCLLKQETEADQGAAMQGGHFSRGSERLQRVTRFKQQHQFVQLWATQWSSRRDDIWRQLERNTLRPVQQEHITIPGLRRQFDASVLQRFSRSQRVVVE